MQLLEQYKKVHEEIESRLESLLSGLTATYGSKEMPKSFQPQIDKIFAVPAGLASRQVPPGRMTEKGTIAKDTEKAAGILLTSSDRAAETSMRQAEAAENSDQVMQSLMTFDTLQADAITLSLPFDEFAPRAAGSFQDMQNLYTCIEYLRYMAGEKHLLFLTAEGLISPSGREDEEQHIAAAANDARVAIDTFHGGGVFPDADRYPNKGNTVSLANPVPPPPESQASWSRTFMISALRDVSELTGGRAAVYRDIGEALDRVNETTRAEYLLGYYPQDEAWDGQYRQIDVKVNRPGLKVSFRHGYYARDTLQPYDLLQFLAYNRMQSAGAYER